MGDTGALEGRREKKKHRFNEQSTLVPDDIRLRIRRAAGRGVVMGGRDRRLSRDWRQAAAGHARRGRAAAVRRRLVTFA